MRAALAVLAGLAALAGPVLAEGGSKPVYRQSPAVLATLPDLAVPLGSPALTPGSTSLTSQADLEKFAASLADSPDAPVVAHTLAVSSQRRAVPILFLTPHRNASPAAIRARGLPIVWLIGQQHGNEPAGGEALLAIAKSLADGELRPLVDKLSIIIVPRANPDGAAADLRDTSLSVDMNRDHLALRLPETRALHAAILQIPPDLVIDAHEFNVASHWLEKFGAVHAVDLMLLSATHPMVPLSVRRMADDVIRPAIDRAAATHGLTTFDYHTTSTHQADRTVSLGGNAAGIARNAFGLSGAVSLLLETRGVGVGREAFQRRVATHYVAIKAALETAAANAAALKQAVAEARAEIADPSKPLVIDHKPGLVRAKLPMQDPATGAKRMYDADMVDTRFGRIVGKRSRPAGYILMPEAAAAAQTVTLLGASACRIAAPLELAVEVFDIQERNAVDLRAIHLHPNIKASLLERRLVIPSGSFYVPLGGPSALRVAMALEADLAGSLFALDLIPLNASQPFAPILRVPGRPPLRAVDGAAACAASVR